MKSWIPILVLAFLGLAVVGYQIQRRTRTSSSAGRLTVADVVLPCIRLYDNGAWEGIEDLAELESMLSERYMNRQRDPILVDSRFRILEMANLKSSGSELGLLLTGPRRIRVTFELNLQPNQSEARAKALLLDHIVNDEAQGSDEFRSQLGSQPSIEEMLRLLRAPQDESPPD